MGGERLSLALLIAAYPQPLARSRAIATWASWGGAALVLGPLTGGVIVDLLGWRSIFLINVPIGLLGVRMTLTSIVPTPPVERRGLDVVGQASAALAVVTLIGCLIQGPAEGWASPLVLGGACVFALSAAAFLRAQARGAAPMLPLSLFRSESVSALSYAFLAGSIAFFGMLFVLSFYFQEIRHYGALRTGLALLPLSSCVVLGNKVAGALVARQSARALMLAGEGFKLVGYWGLLLVWLDAGYASLALPLALIGFGGGLCAPMYTAAFMSSVAPAFTGIASGVSRATGQIGSAFGVAVFGALIADRARFVERMSLSILASAALTGSIWVAIRRALRDPADGSQAASSVPVLAERGEGAG